MDPCSEESRNWIRLLLFLCSKPDDLMIKSERSIREIDGGRSRMHIHPDVHTYIFPWFRHSGKNLELRKRVTEIRRGTQGDQRTRRGERQSRRLSRREEKKKSSLSSSVRLLICHVYLSPRDRGLHRSGLVQERRLDRGPRKSRGKTGCPRNGPASQWHKPLLTCARIRVRSLKRIIV